MISIARVRNRWRAIVITGGFGALCIAVLVALKLLHSTSAGSDESTAGSINQPVRVEAAKAELSPLHPSLELVGQVIAMPERTAVVSSQAGGWIDSIDVVEGQLVRAGAVLAKLDARLANSDLLRAEAALSEKQATLAKLKRGYLPPEIDAARATRNGDQANVESLHTELAALQKLFQRHEISNVQLNTKQDALRAAEATLAAANANLKLMEQGTRPEAIAEAQAQVKASAANVKAAQLAVDWCTIRSPIDGMVVQLSARLGQYVDRAVPLATVTDLSTVFVQLRIPSDALAKVAVATPVDVRVEAFPGKIFAGKVARRSAEADPQTGDLNMYVAVPNSKNELRPGLSCRARVFLPAIPNALSVPTSAIADHNGAAVVTVIRDGKAYETTVAVAAQAEGRSQILSGLSPGDVVATKGGYGLPDGYPVEIVPKPGKG
ncbi:MAG TPA: efflux RND transporter periplasmic adaptor subunit [Lacipirellulaceae bacterium]|nr:efflux RND transporter periplasmic adaptor subunit [Lacipirellulaceae bacterium]